MENPDGKFLRKSQAWTYGKVRLVASSNSISSVSLEPVEISK